MVVWKVALLPERTIIRLEILKYRRKKNIGQLTKGTRREAENQRLLPLLMLTRMAVQAGSLPGFERRNQNLFLVTGDDNSVQVCYSSEVAKASDSQNEQHFMELINTAIKTHN